MDELGIMFHHARLQAIEADRKAVLLAMLKERGLMDEATERQPFIWRAEISNTSLDTHYTKMSPATLRNYADDAKAGVAFLKGHDHRSLPIGYSFNAELEDVGDKQRVVADFYTVPGLTESDDLIARVQHGLLRDVSVGFRGGEMRCNLCSKDFWSCELFPGVRYDGNLATFTIDNARLSEVSGVFDGSTPGAMILKATREAEAGRLKPETIRLLEQCYRVVLPATQRAFAGVDTGQKPREAEIMTEEQFKQLVRAIGDSGVATAEERTAMTEDMAVALVERMVGRLRVAEPQAADGRQYRSDLVAEALAEGVRAQGKDFDKATYEATLTNAPIATIKRMRDDWKKVGDERLAGGRKSVDDAQDSKDGDKQVKPVSVIPDMAYRG